MVYKKIEIKSGEYTIADLQDELVLYTKQLDSEIAYSIFSPKLRKVGLARSLSPNKLADFFNEMNPDNLNDPRLMAINVVGGDDSDDSTKALRDLILELEKIDNKRDIINIRSCDTCSRIHPNSFEVDCYHGGIRAIVT
jgi:hypothetical protein